MPRDLAEITAATQSRLLSTADKVHTVVDAARKLTDLPDVEGEDSMLFWESYGALRDAVQALDGTRLADTIRASERIVRDRVEVFDLPCGHRYEDACDSCVPDAPLNWHAEVEARADELGGAS